MNELIESAAIDFCLEDPTTKKILRNEKGGYEYTKVDIDARITEGDYALTAEEKEFFSGIVIPEIKEE